jgi:hypothetical protein
VTDVSRAIGDRAGITWRGFCGFEDKCDPALAKLYIFSALVRYKNKLMMVSIAPNWWTIIRSQSQAEERKKGVVSYSFSANVLNSNSAYGRQRPGFCPYQSYYVAKQFCERTTDQREIYDCRKYNLLSK